MSLTHAIAKNTSVQIVGKTFSTLLGLAAVAIMTHTLGVEKFGWYVTATGFLQFVGIFSDFGFTIITAKMLSEPEFDKTDLINNLFTWRFITAFVFQALAPLLILLFPYPVEIKMAVAIMSLSFFAISLNNIFIGYCQSNLKMAIQMTGEVLGRIILVLGLILVASKNYPAHGGTPLQSGGGFLWAMGIITLASVFYTFYLWLKTPRVKFAINAQISKAIFYKIWPTATTVIFNAFYLQGDRVILPLYVSQTEVGLYGAAYRILDIITQSAGMIMGIMMPLVAFAWSRNLVDEFKKRYQTSLDLVALFLAPMMAGIVVLANPIMLLIGGQGFAGSGRILQFLSIAIIGISFGNIFGYIALAIDRQKQALWIYISDAILTVIAYFVFIPRYGIYGAAGAAVFSELYAGIGLMLLANHYAKFTPRFKALGKIVLASAIMGAAIYRLQPMNIMISILLGVVIYTTLVLLFKVVSKETIKEIVGQKL